MVIRILDRITGSQFVYHNRYALILVLFVLMVLAMLSACGRMTTTPILEPFEETQTAESGAMLASPTDPGPTASAPAASETKPPTPTDTNTPTIIEVTLTPTITPRGLHERVKLQGGDHVNSH